MTENSKIATEIEAEVRRRFRYARCDFLLHHILILIAVLASAFPAFAQIVGGFSSAQVALIAAIPAFVLLLQRTFKWEQRSNWHWEYRRQLLAIQREMRDQQLPPAEASKKVNALEAAVAKSFPSASVEAG